MPCGTSSAVSTTPATRSFASQEERYDRSVRIPGGSTDIPHHLTDVASVAATVGSRPGPRRHPGGMTAVLDLRRRLVKHCMVNRLSREVLRGVVALHVD